MKNAVPNPWLILGTILGSAAIVTATRSASHVLFILVIGAGAISGLSLFLRLRTGDQRSGKTFAISSFFGLVSGFASLAACGACAADPDKTIYLWPPPGPLLPQFEPLKDEGLLAASECHVLKRLDQSEIDGWLHLTNLRLLVRTAEGERSIPIERIDSMEENRNFHVISVPGDDPLIFRSAKNKFIRTLKEAIQHEKSDS